MKRLASLLVCLSLSIFTMARPIKPSHMLAVIGKSAEKNATEQKANAKTLLDDANKALAQSEEQEAAGEEDTDEGMASDGDGTEDASDDEGEDIGDDDASEDDNGGDDDNGDADGGADGGDVSGD